MRITATADLHGYLPEIPETDLLLIAGDVCPVWDHDRKFQANWLRSTFSEWLDQVPAQVIVGIGGNHDFILNDNKIIGNQLPWCYLADETKTVKISERLEVREVKIYGSPYSNKFGNWAFMTGETELGFKYRDIPRDVDIIMTHGPAFGYGDEVPSRVWRGKGLVTERVGSTSLTNQLTYDTWENLKLVVYGHIHPGYGTYNMPKGVTSINGAYCNDELKPGNPPITIEL